ncbi:MAG: inositol monophosphatase family protein [Schleiferiaceae bacterium]
MSAVWERAVREVGDWIRGERREFAANRVESKSLNSLVSYVDQQAEQMLVQRLTDALPGSGVLGEEGSESWVDGGANWIIDPLDGTTNFIHDLPPYAVSVALMQDRELVWAAVYELGQARMFTAAKGHGAHCDGKPLDITGGAALRDGLVATGFPYHEFSQMPAYLEALQACFRGSRGVRRFGSAATDLAWLADGRFQGFFEHGLAPWDVAAGILLVREAGGVATDFHGTELDDYDLVRCGSITAGTPRTYADLLPITHEAFCAK